jgi:hypothetical protein
VLELRPICENCAKPLPPDSTEARICSFECTFCAGCANGVLGGVCPNCAGNFVPRPIRPTRNWRGENYLGRYPASERRRHRPVDVEAHRKLVAEVAGGANLTS